MSEALSPFRRGVNSAAQMAYHEMACQERSKGGVAQLIAIAVETCEYF